jgi:hypothetical protein
VREENSRRTPSDTRITLRSLTQVTAEMSGNRYAPVSRAEDNSNHTIYSSYCLVTNLKIKGNQLMKMQLLLEIIFAPLNTRISLVAV